MGTAKVKYVRDLLQADATAFAIGTHLIHFIRARYTDEFASYLQAQTSNRELIGDNELLNIAYVFQCNWKGCKEAIAALAEKHEDEDIPV
jgi:hypothetical protein